MPVHGQTEWLRRHKKTLGGFGGGVGLAGLLAFAVPDYVRMRDCQSGQAGKITDLEKRIQEMKESSQRQWQIISVLQTDVATMKVTKRDK